MLRDIKWLLFGHPLDKYPLQELIERADTLSMRDLRYVVRNAENFANAQTRIANAAIALRGVGK